LDCVVGCGQENAGVGELAGGDAGMGFEGSAGAWETTFSSGKTPIFCEGCETSFGGFGGS
jgi:hypothetical protein